MSKNIVARARARRYGKFDVLVASTACGALGVPGGVSRVVPHARQARCSDLWGVAGLLISEGKKIADPLSNAPMIAVLRERCGSKANRANQSEGFQHEEHS